MAKYKIVFYQPSPKHKGMGAAAILCLGEPAGAEKGEEHMLRPTEAWPPDTIQIFTEDLTWVKHCAISPSGSEVFSGN